MNAELIEDIYPLSPMQQGMLFHSLYEPASGAYVVQLSYILEGDVDVAALERAWRTLVERHPVLRTDFNWEDADKPIQMVYRQVDLPFEHYDWRGVAADEQAERISALLEADRQRGFELAQAPLLRLSLIRLAENRYQFVQSHHHILLDGWCTPLIMGEVFRLYGAFAQGQPLSLPPARPYKEYIAWLQRQDAAAAESFWRTRLAGFLAPTPLGVDRPAGGDIPAEYAEQRAAVGPATTAALQALARQHQLTLNTLVQGAWGLLLSRYSGQRDVVFGATVAGRPADLPGVETMIGMFINTLPVRLRVRDDQGWLEWLADIQAEQIELRQYEYSSLIDVQGWSDVPRGTQLFESILVFENYPVEAMSQEHEDRLKIRNVHGFEQTNYPLTLMVSPRQELLIRAMYDQRRFDAATIERLIAHFKLLLARLAENPAQPLGTVGLLAEAERAQLTAGWNDTALDYPPVSVAKVIADRAALAPDATAATMGAQALSYRQLDQRSTALAAHLQGLGVGPGVLVGIYLERSLDMLVAVLAVLKSGGGYVPLDPANPAERIALMIGDSQAAVFLTQESLAGSLPADGARLICLDSFDDTAPAPLRAYDSNEHTAYVIYTSGSTGTPKGVQISHRALVNFLTAMQDRIGLEAGDRLLAVTTLSFDIAGLELLWPLTVGAQVVIASYDEARDGGALGRLLDAHGISVMQATPTTWRLLLESGWRSRLPLVALCGGEALPWALAEALLPQVAALWNVYGPTETTIWSTARRVQPGDGLSLVGSPLANTDLYIVDDRFEPTPLGVAGELLIGGAGLADGYLKRPALTAERFVPHPFAARSGARLYRTGDLARYRADGSIEFLGRLDHQVKVRGVRIELGEIEAVLERHPQVRQSVAVVHTYGAPSEGNQRLVAYAVPRPGATLAVQELRALLQAALPAAMIPTTIMLLDEFPLTANGKINRGALPRPDREHAALDRDFAAPRTPAEEMLADMWQQVLGIAHVGIHDHFFALGGHSLLATQVVARVRNTFGVELPLRALFESPTVAEFAVEIERALAADQPQSAPIVPVPRDRPLPLSYTQQRQWILHQLTPGAHVYNGILPLQLRGDLDPAALAGILSTIVARHEMLRTTFPTVDGQPIQQVHAPQPVPLPLFDLSGLPAAEQPEALRRRIAEIQGQPFDLAVGPLFHAELVRLAADEHVLLISMHHIITDDWSTTILFQEMALLSQSMRSGQPAELPPLPIQYGDFAVWQHQWLAGPAGQSQLEYWRGQLSNLPPALELPVDQPRSLAQDFHGATRMVTLPAELAADLQSFCVQADATMFMAILAAYQTLLHRYSGQNDLVVGAFFTNRSHVEIERLIGYFLNSLPLRVSLADQPTFDDLLARVREVVLAAYAHQDVPFEMLVELAGASQRGASTPLFQVGLNFANVPMPQVEVPGMTIGSLAFEQDTAEQRLDQLGQAAAQLDITLTVRRDKTGSGLSLAMYYNTALFSQATIDRMLRHLLLIIEAMVEQSELPIDELELVEESERRELLEAWGLPATPPAAPDTLPALVARAAAHAPDAPALVMGSQRLTYAEVQRQIEALAGRLQELGVGPEVPVALAANRTPTLVIAMLAILAAGGVYVPLDPSYPAERQAWMLEDSAAPVILAEPGLIAMLPPTPARVINLEEAFAPGAALVPPALLPEHPAYLIYTSGSTGRPKGVPITHGSITQLMAWGQTTLDLGGGSRVLQTLSPAFDFGTFELLSTLVSGATLVFLPPEHQNNLIVYVEAINQHSITVIHSTPAFFAAVVALGTPLPSLRIVHLGGEALPATLIQNAAAILAPECRIFNGYGPTEATVNCAIYPVDRAADASAPSIPIGRATAHHRLYVLDERGGLVPPGVIGELCVGGAGLSWGYWKQPRLSAERFLPDPYSGQPGARYYRTGDRVRYNAQGQLEHLGRIDSQVKVRGYRIELGEVEGALRQLEGVADAVALVRSDDSNQTNLIGYVMPAEGVELSPALLQPLLRKLLPLPMVPSRIVVLPILPRTVNGKLDRDALRRLELEYSRDVPYVAPSTTLEVMIADVWGGLLKRDDIGIHDNFFAIGGHSLLATQVVYSLGQALELAIPLRKLFEHPTVADLALAVEELLLDELDNLSDEETDYLLHQD